MQSRRMILVIATIGVAICQLASLALAQAQQPAVDASAAGTTTIHAESRLVLVDTVVTDKKGNYVRDLTVKDFKVWEDNKEQSIKNFSFEDDSASPDKAQKRYMVLFFDNSTMDMSDQMYARQAAAKFVDANAGPNRLIAVVDFGGSIHIAQNFTSDTDRLKKVVAAMQGSSVSPNAPVRQIWISALATSFKLDWSDERKDFVLTKTGEGLKALVTRLINQQLGEETVSLG